jgi:hypothetical protein
MVTSVTTERGAFKRRLAAVALSVVLLGLVAYWASLDAEECRPRSGARRRPVVRSAAPVSPRIFVCETLAVCGGPYAVNFAACPRPALRLTPFRPRQHPFERN